MTTDYDPIARRYQQAKQQPWRTHVERFTLLEIIGDVTGLAVLDLACGEGYYTRILAQNGARHTCGMDLSGQMIELARDQERTNPLGIEYLVGDAREVNSAAQFELVVAAYLLNYARNEHELGIMCKAIAKRLVPGGRFVTVNCSPLLNFCAAPSFLPYGFETKASDPLRPGTPITWTFHLDDRSFSIENYYLDQAAHEQALCAAGFRNIRWHPPRLAPEAGEGDFWLSLLEHSPFVFIECWR
jgi:SAM-dependent methyltransferase